VLVIRNLDYIFEKIKVWSNFRKESVGKGLHGWEWSCKGRFYPSEKCGKNSIEKYYYIIYLLSITPCPKWDSWDAVIILLP